MALRGLDVVDAVRVVNVTDRRRHQRINPDDVAAHVPEALRDPGGGGWPPIVDEPRLMPVVWQALRELTATVRQLTATLDAHQQRLAAQQRQLDDHEARIAVLEPPRPPRPPSGGTPTNVPRF